MNFFFFPNSLVRTPFYSYRDYQYTDLSALLKDSYFQKAIFFASRSFYEELRKKNFELELLSEKQRQSVTKYFNRSTFRSTPFGLFSTFSVVPWSNHGSERVVLASQPLHHLKLDFSVMMKLYEAVMQEKPSSVLRFFPNSTIFFTETDMRYIRTHVNGKDETLFSVISIKKNHALKQVLNFCKGGRSAVEIKEYITEQLQSDEESTESFVQEMYQQELIIPDIKPNVIGSYFGNRLFEEVANLEGANARSQALIGKLRELAKSKDLELTDLREIDASVYSQLPVNRDLKSIFYNVSERPFLKGGLPMWIQDAINEGVQCLSYLSAPHHSPDLDRFKRMFLSRYQSGEIPLLEVMDPQLGIGYGSLDKMKDSLGLFDLADPDQLVLTQENEQVTKDDLHKRLLRQWQAAHQFSPQYELIISEEDLQLFSTRESSVSLPPSIAVMYRLSGDRVFLEDVGGNSAISLLGRFSCSEEVAHLCREITAKEQELNPNVIFAEISHVCNLHTANINQRDHLREYEIPVLTHSFLGDEQQISLDDIMVSVNGDTVVLWSRRHKKRIIPRLGTAFNYVKNKLPVFRFLCDVQNQGVQTVLGFDTPSLLPGLRFYPRVSYGKCIFQLAEWHFDQADFNEINAAPPQEQISLFRDLCKREQLSRYIAYSFFDNYIIYDTTSRQEVSSFLTEIRNKQRIIVREFPFITEESHVCDEHTRPLLAQYVTAIYSQQETYSAASIKKSTAMLSKQADDSVNWLYFKIYCHPLSADHILTESIFPLIKKITKEGMIYEWFWIRYHDPEPHLRLRVLPAPNMMGACFEILNEKLNRLLQVKMVSRFQTDQYKRELERYSPELIVFIEKIFCVSSNLAAEVLKTKQKMNYNEEGLLIEATVFILRILQTFPFQESAKPEFLKAAFEGFFEEFNKPWQLKTAIEKLHKSVYPKINKLTVSRRMTGFYTTLNRHIEILQTQKKLRRVRSVSIEELAADIIHLHQNRLFADKQRYFEMVSYYLALRTLQTEMNFRNKKEKA